MQKFQNIFLSFIIFDSWLSLWGIDDFDTISFNIRKSLLQKINKVMTFKAVLSLPRGLKNIDYTLKMY